VTNQDKIIDYHSRGFCRRDIMQLMGCDAETVSAALRDPDWKLELRAEAHRLLKRCPQGRDPDDHERIVRMNFAEAFSD
jgi:hypothetical protein